VRRESLIDLKVLPFNNNTVTTLTFEHPTSLSKVDNISQKHRFAP